MRAVTEAALGRNAQIQGVRKDAVGCNNFDGNSQGLWCCNAAYIKSFDNVPSYENNDILDDISLMLSQLRERGVSHVIAVDLTCKRLNIPVIRIIVPELECWWLRSFDPNNCRLGKTALSYLI